MASGGLLSYALGMPAHRRERREQLSDEERQLTVSDLYKKGDALAKIIPSLSGDDRETAMGQLTDIQKNIHQIYHPDNNPGAVQKDWHFLKNLITGRKPAPPPVASPVAPQAQVSTPTFPATVETMAVPSGPETQQKVFDPRNPVPNPAHAHISTVTAPGSPESSISVPVAPLKLPDVKVTTPALPASEAMAVPTPKIKGLVAPGNIPIWNRPAVKNDDGTVSSEFSTSFIDENKKSPYFGKEVLVPTVVAGKFLTPDGKKPPEGSQEEHDMLEKARAHYEQTGQHLGVFDSPQSADKYSQQLHSRGDRPRPDAAAYQTPAQRKQQAQQDVFRKQAEIAVAAEGSPEQRAQATVGEQLARLNIIDKLPGISAEEKEEAKQHLMYAVLGVTETPKYFSQLQTTTGPDGKIHVYRVPMDPRFDPQEVTFGEGEKFVGKPGAAPKGMTFDKSTGQVVDKDKNIRYSKDDPNLPPEVKAMFRGQAEADAVGKAYGLRLADERGKSFSFNRPMPVFDTQTNTNTVASFGQMQQEPGRYQPAGPAAKALSQTNMFEDIGRTSRAAREAINKLSEDFPEDMKAKIAVAMRSENPDSALGELLSSAALGSLTPDQFGFLVAARQLAENAMAMRSILGAGQGSEDVRRAIQSTLPGLLSPNRQYALMQLDAFDKTLEQLHRGIPGIKLGPANWTVQGGDTQQPTGGGGARPPIGSGYAQQPARSGSPQVSLSAAMDIYKKNHPDDKNVTKEKVIEDLKSHGITRTIDDVAAAPAK